MNFKELALKLQRINEGSIPECGEDMSSMLPGIMMHKDEPQKQADNVSMSININGQGAGGLRDLMDILRDIEDGESGEDDQMIVGGGSIDQLFGKSEEEPEHGIIDDDFENAPMGADGPHTFPQDTLMKIGSNDGRGDNEALKVNGGGQPHNISENLIKELHAHYVDVKNRALTK